MRRLLVPPTAAKVILRVDDRQMDVCHFPLSELDSFEPVRGELKSGAHRPAQLHRVREAYSLVVFDKTM